MKKVSTEIMLYLLFGIGAFMFCMSAKTEYDTMAYIIQSTVLLWALSIFVYIKIRNKKFNNLIINAVNSNKYDVALELIEHAMHGRKTGGLKSLYVFTLGLSGDIKSFDSQKNSIKNIKQKDYVSILCIQNAIAYLNNDTVQILPNMQYEYKGKNNRLYFLMNDIIVNFDNSKFAIAEKCAKDLIEITTVLFYRCIAYSILSTIYFQKDDVKNSVLCAQISIESAPSKEIESLLYQKHRKESST